MCKVGYGESCHYHIVNDINIGDTLLTICSIDGKFFLRDFGQLHPLKVKLDDKIEVQIQKGTVINLGHAIHYHFDKVKHGQKPITE